MQQGYPCPRCGRLLRYIPEYRNWYCDNCRLYPYAQQMAMPYYPPKKDDSAKTIIIVVVIVVVLVIIIPLILAAVLYFMVSDMVGDFEMTPTGTLDFQRSPTEPGVYTGFFTSLSENMDLEDVSMTILDVGTGSATLGPLVDGGIAQVPGGMNCTFYDTNHNDELDTNDRFVIYNGDSDDIIRIIYRPTGGMIASGALT